MDEDMVRGLEREASKVAVWGHVSEAGAACPSGVELGGAGIELNSSREGRRGAGVGMKRRGVSVIQGTEKGKIGPRERVGEEM